MRVIFAGGGTGGHLYPSAAVAEVLSRRGVDFKFLVSDRGIDARILTSLGYDYAEQNVSPFMGTGLAGRIKALAKLCSAVVKTYPLINKGDKVILTGGFAAAPAAVAAKLKGCELYLHEQNSVMGLVNRIFAKGAKKVFLSFPDTKNASGNTIVTGNPVRRIFRTLGKKEGYSGSVLVLGGSQGSRAINKIITDSIDGIMEAGFTVTHQTGEGLFRETMETYGSKTAVYGDRLFVRPYIDGVASVMSESDIVVARAGAGTVFELAAIGCPAVYIPLKSASENHQYYNALAAEKAGGALILDEDEARGGGLIDKLNEIKNNINVFRSRLRERPLPDSAEMIVREAGIE